MTALGDRQRLASARDAVRRALALFGSQPLGIRLFAAARRALAPLPRILAAVPPSGGILDVGCGHGLFACAMALETPARTVVGIDPSPAKFAVAQAVGKSVANASFRLGRLEDLEIAPCQVITVLDVLYLLDAEDKLALLRRCRELLADGGTLIVKTNDTRPRWKYHVARLQEKAMIGAGLTLGTGQTHFLGRAENLALVERAGFRARTVDLNSWLPYPHVMFVGEPV